MARVAGKNDFPLEVEGVGMFVFGRRTLADQIKINVEYSRLTEAVEPTPWLDQVATWLATLKVMTVRTPDTFVVDELDPLDEDTYAKLLKVHMALVAKEQSFRLKPDQAGQAGGSGAGKIA